MGSTIEHRRARALESTDRRRGQISDPIVVDLIGKLIDYWEPWEETSWARFWHFGLVPDVHLHEDWSSPFLSDPLAVNEFELPHVFHAGFSEVWVPSETNLWFWNPTRRTGPSQYIVADEAELNPEPDWSSQSELYLRAMEDVLNKYKDGRNTSEDDQDEIEYVFEPDQDGDGSALETDQEEAELVLQALNNPKYRWRTVAGIAKETGLDPDIVTDELGRLKDQMVRSTRSTKDGQEVFATRERFKQFASPWTKILGALKNRAD